MDSGEACEDSEDLGQEMRAEAGETWFKSGEKGRIGSRYWAKVIEMLNAIRGKTFSKHHVLTN